MSVGVDAFGADYERLVDDRRRAQRLGNRVDRIMLGGLLLAVILSSADPRVLEIEDGSILDLGWIVAQRLSVYLPLAVGLLFGIPVRRLILRLPLGLFFAFTIWALIAATAVDQPLDEVDRTLWFASFVIVAAMTTLRVGWERLIVSVAAVGAVFVAVSLAAHLLGLLPETGNEFFDGRLFGLDRVRGLAPQENAFGRAGAYTALLGLVMLVSPSFARRTPLALISLAVGLTGLLASQSRFALISLFFAGLIVVARHVAMARIPSVLLILAAGAAVGVVLITGSLGPFARSDEPGEATSLFGRTEVWEQAIDVAVDRPVFGIGTEGLTTRYLELDAAGVFDWNPTNAHNLVLQTMASHGVIGAWLVVASLVLGIAHAFRSEIPGVFEVVVMFAIQGFVESILIGNPTIAPLLLVGSLSAITMERLSSRGQS